MFHVSCFILPRIDLVVLLTDYEARIILPHLIGSLGHSDSLCSSIRDLLSFLPQVYPASKLFPFFLDGLEASRSPRASSEILSQMADLIRQWGLLQSPSNPPSKWIPSLVKSMNQFSLSLSRD